MAGISMVDVPTWVVAIGTAVAALGTVGTLIAALVQIGSERKRRLEDADKDRAERHSAQARLISAVVADTDQPAELPAMSQVLVHLVNSSSEPVYRLVVGSVFIQGAAPATLEQMVAHFAKNPSGPGPFTTVSILPSGQFEVSIPYAGDVMAGRLAVEVAFTDRDGHFWIRRATGQLQELQQEPFDHFRQFGLLGPYRLDTPKRAK